MSEEKEADQYKVGTIQVPEKNCDSTNPPVATLLSPTQIDDKEVQTSEGPDTQNAIISSYAGRDRTSALSPTHDREALNQSFEPNRRRTGVSKEQDYPVTSMARSIVTMLTAASMYAGMELDAHAESEADDDDGDEDEKVVDPKEDLEGSVILKEADLVRDESDEPQVQDMSQSISFGLDELVKKSLALEERNKVPNNAGEELKLDPGAKVLENSLPPLEKKPSRFELSVIKKISSGKNEESSSASDRQRASAICNKLSSAIDIAPDESYISDWNCWLLRDVLLQGHLYLTTKHLCFFAYLPKRPGEIIMSGSLGMRSYSSRGVTKKWAILTDRTLSLYSSSTDLYFPYLTIDLRYAIRAQTIFRKAYTHPEVIFGHGTPAGSYCVKLLTEKKSYTFEADSEESANAWTDTLKKYIFAARQKGDNVSMKVPLKNVLDLEVTPILDSTKTLKVKVIESPETFALDDYHLMLFSNADDAIAKIEGTITQLDESFYHKDGVSNDPQLLAPSVSMPDGSGSRPGILKKLPSSPRLPASSISKLAKSLSPRRLSKSSSGAESVVEKMVRYDEGEVPEIVLCEDGQVKLNQRDTEQSETDSEVVVEGSSIQADPVASIEQGNNEAYYGTSPRWSSRKLVKGMVELTSSGVSHVANLSNMWSASPNHYNEANAIERGPEDPFFVRDSAERAEATRRYQQHFSLAHDSILISSYYGYLLKSVPLYGKIYLGDSSICYRSLIPGTATKMILPFADIENVYKEKSFRFGYYGLVLVIHGYEEAFFEFGSAEARDDCEHLLLKQIDYSAQKVSAEVSSRAESPSEAVGTVSAIADARLRLFESKLKALSGTSIPIILEDNPHMRTDFKPDKSYKFVLLTIGSRGDVQPYIALGRGLIKEGHKAKIVTHLEFKPWIEKHGIEFGEVAGNPAELMSLMVTHSTLSVSFLKEASSKFRGWIDELLASAWKACCDGDVLIESPSAMAGIHIAEALGIPYFRAFTMPWTRTRAYPHAFIVPDHKRGGSYNYLTHVMFENVFWKGISSQVNKWRCETLKLDKTSLDQLQQAKVPFLYNISPTVFAPSVDFPNWVKVTGYWFLDEGSTYEPPNDLLTFMKTAKADGKKLVYIGFGSIVVAEPKLLTEVVVDAVVEADVRCILSKGWSDRLGSENSHKLEVALPDCIFNVGSIPHDWLFTQVDAAVHHGGSGTTGASLRAGLPSIIRPFFGDQFFYANRVVDIGAGIALRRMNAHVLAKAIKEVTSNQRIIMRAKDIGAKIRDENGVTTAISTIYSQLEYAKSLITSKKHQPVAPQEAVSPDFVTEIKDDDGSWLML